MKPTYLAVALVVAALAASPVIAKPAANAAATTTGAKAPVKGVDQQFMMKAAAGGAAEVAFGQVAQTNATNAEVKSFAQQMVTDHTAANEQLMNLAKELNVTNLPKAMDAKHKALLQKMQKTKGAAFDKAYMKSQVADHQATVALFENEVKKGKNQQVVAWAKDTLPKLQEHLKMAKDTQAKLK